MISALCNGSQPCAMDLSLVQIVDLSLVQNVDLSLLQNVDLNLVQNVCAHTESQYIIIIMHFTCTRTHRVYGWPGLYVFTVYD